MKQVTFQMATRYQVARMMVRQRTREALEDERGEVGSWMIVAAGLAGAAVAVVAIIAPWLEDQARLITGEAAP